MVALDTHQLLGVVLLRLWRFSSIQRHKVVNAVLQTRRNLSQQPQELVEQENSAELVSPHGEMAALTELPWEVICTGA